MQTESARKDRVSTWLAFNRLNGNARITSICMRKSAGATTDCGNITDISSRRLRDMMVDEIFMAQHIRSECFIAIVASSQRATPLSSLCIRVLPHNGIDRGRNRIFLSYRDIYHPQIL